MVLLLLCTFEVAIHQVDSGNTSLEHGIEKNLLHVVSTLVQEIFVTVNLVLQTISQSSQQKFLLGSC